MFEITIREGALAGPSVALDAAVAAAAEILRCHQETPWVDIRHGAGVLRVRPGGTELTFDLLYRPGGSR